MAGALAIAALTAGAAPWGNTLADEPSEALVKARQQVFNPAINAVTFRNLMDFFPTEAVSPADVPSPLPREDADLDIKFTFEGKTYSLEEALQTARTNGFLVIHKGKIVAERYYNGAAEDSLFASFSMSKSVTSILVGTAIRQGHIKSVDERLDTYLPELKGTAYDGVTIKQALLMRSGVAFQESYRFDEPNHLSILFDQAMVRNKIRFADFSSLDLKRGAEPGTKFNYSTLETNVLGRLVVAATGMRLADYMEEALWHPAGMEAPALWLLDGDEPEGQAIAGGGLNVTLRDYGRIGLMMLNGGTIGGNRILSEEWVAESTIPDGTEPARPERPERPQGYQYQWWTMPESDAYSAKGIHGQFIYVDPETETVIVKTSYWPGAWIRDLEKLTLASFRAVTAELTN
jgi:CubicO group peptidase (beta-lactamase class C family)